MAKTKKRADGLIERCRVIDGKTRHFYGRTAKEVQAKLDAALIEASTRRDRGDPFCEVAEAFWRTKEPCIKYGSRRGYLHKVELAKGWFEGQGMREITSTDINRELMHMAAQGYAYKSIAGQKSVLSLIWQYWCAEMNGDTNPCTLLKLPQGLPQKKRRAPTEQEIADVKAHPEGFGLCPAIMMYAGLRLGEVMALQKKDLADGAPLYKTIMEPDFTAHQLRHEFASTLVQCGISPQVAKELMGHADILTTQRWYAEAKASAVDEATRILNAHFTA